MNYWYCGRRVVWVNLLNLIIRRIRGVDFETIVPSRNSRLFFELQASKFAVGIAQGFGTGANCIVSVQACYVNCSTCSSLNTDN